MQGDHTLSQVVEFHLLEANLLHHASQGLLMYSEFGSKFPSTAPGLDVEDKAFIDCVLDDKPVPVTGEDGIIALKMVLAAVESIAIDAPVKIE